MILHVKKKMTFWDLLKLCIFDVKQKVSSVGRAGVTCIEALSSLQRPRAWVLAWGPLLHVISEAVLSIKPYKGQKKYFKKQCEPDEHHAMIHIVCSTLACLASYACRLQLRVFWFVSNNELQLHCCDANIQQVDYPISLKNVPLDRKPIPPTAYSL